MKNARWMSVFTTTGIVVWASSALAAEAAKENEATASPAATDESPARKMHLAVEPPPAPLQRTDYVHEGFYFRFSAGPGFMTTAVKDKATDDKASSTDFSLGTDLLIGGSPTPGMTFGGGVQGNLGFSTDPTFSYLVGPFFDAFPNNKEGFHLGTMLGFAGAALSNGPSSSLFGGGLSAWGGYDIWVAPEWSVGMNLRGTGAQLMSANGTATNFSLHFLITVLSH